MEEIGLTEKRTDLQKILMWVQFKCKKVEIAFFKLLIQQKASSCHKPGPTRSRMFQKSQKTVLYEKLLTHTKAEYP